MRPYNAADTGKASACRAYSQHAEPKPPPTSQLAMTDISNDATHVARRIADTAADCGITLVASLPDGWITPLIARFAGDGRFRHVAVNREESAIGLCSGAFLGGIGALALMGASGFLTCIYAITKINYTYQIPLLIGITLRGRPGDSAKFHQSNGLYLEPVIAAIGMPFVAIERGDDIARLATAYRHSRVMSRPVVVGFTREMLRGEA
jgi:sulfopyruvate decarboxylase subunit alpha